MDVWAVFCAGLLSGGIGALAGVMFAVHGFPKRRECGEVTPSLLVDEVHPHWSWCVETGRHRTHRDASGFTWRRTPSVDH